MTAVSQTVSLSAPRLTLSLCKFNSIFLRINFDVKFLCHFDNEASIKFNEINTHVECRDENNG